MGCFWGDEWYGFEINDFSVDLWGDRPKPLFQEANVMCFVCLSLCDSGDNRLVFRGVGGGGGGLVLEGQVFGEGG